jgi:hypothetical protein
MKILTIEKTLVNVSGEKQKKSEQNADYNRQTRKQ